ncbi:MAG TPA: hypothetical protein VJ385_19015 [Fibrobacteria bacterium]|nr:hypothetical protein [Fibrobacteria bacterium]
MRPEKWSLVLDETLDDLPEAAPVFGTRAWLEATRRALPFPLKVLKVYKGETFAAYLPLQFIKRGGLVKAFVPILTFYGGPYFVPGRRKHFNDEIKEQYEILGCVLAWLESRSHYSLLLPEWHDARPAMARNWRCLPRYTVVNRLRSENTLDVNQDCQSNIRKAERAGLAFGTTDGEDAFEDAYARTFVRKGLAMKWKPRWAADLRRELTGTGLMEHWAVRTAQGKAIAFASVALDRFRNSAIIWCSCSLAEADRTGAMHFMVRNLILRYKDEFETFDLCGADHRSLSEFKEKFANQLLTRFSLEKYRGPATRALLKGFEMANGILRRIRF